MERSSRWIWNFWMPFMPSSAVKPWRGTLEVPVTNCRNLARSAWSKERRALQNHWIYDTSGEKHTGVVRDNHTAATLGERGGLIAEGECVVGLQSWLAACPHLY